MWRSGFLQMSLLVLMASIATAGVASGVYSRAMAGREAKLVLEPNPAIKRPVAVNRAVVTAPDRPLANLQDAPKGRDGDNPADLRNRAKRNYRIQLTRDGLIPGRINLLDPVSGDVQPMTNVTITMLQHGVVKATAKPGVRGVFQIAGLKPGVYSLIGAGTDGFIAHGVQVTAFDEPVAPQPAVRTASFVREKRASVAAIPVHQKTEELLDIDTLAVPRRDFGSVLQLAKSYLPPNLTNPRSGELPEIARPGATTDELLPELNDAPSTVIKSHSVEIQADGHLVGRIRRIHPEDGKPTQIRQLNVFLVKDNVVVGKSSVDEVGAFSFKEISPGGYSFVAAGVEGFAAFFIQAVQTNAVVNNPKREWIVPVGFMAQAEVPGLDGILLDASDVAEAIKSLDAIQNNNGTDGSGLGSLGNLMTNGGNGGAGSGGAGSGGGFAGIAAGLAAAGAAIAATQNVVSTAITPVP